MPKYGGDEVITEGMVRYWVQKGGASPLNEMMYAGDDTQYMIIGDTDAPIRGDINPIRVPDPYLLKAYRNVGKTEEAPDLPTFPITFLRKHGTIPTQLYNLGDCNTNYYDLMGKCGNLGDFEKGWDLLLIRSNALVSDRTMGGVGGWDSDDAIEDETTNTADNIYPVGKMAFKIELDDGTYTSVVTIDAVYGTPSTCALCREGTEHIYAIGNNSNDRNIYYTLDGGATWSVVALATSANMTLTAIGLAGNTLIISFGESAAPGGYWTSTIDPNSGIPGTPAKITSGVTSGEVLNDLFVYNPRKVFFAADDGKIYRTSTFAGGVTLVATLSADNVTRIDGVPTGIMVAGTFGGEVYYSLDGGDTWTQTADDPGGAITALAVLDENRIWVGTDSPSVEFTNDFGATWRVISLPTDFGNLLTVYDIAFATDEVGYISTQIDKTGGTDFAIYWTINGGESWALGESRFAQFIFSSAIFGRIATPTTKNVAVNANNALLSNNANGLYILSAAVK